MQDDELRQVVRGQVVGNGCDLHVCQIDAARDNGEEGGIRGVSVGSDPQERRSGCEGGRVDNVLSPLDPYLGDGVKIHRVQARVVHGHET